MSEVSSYGINPDSVSNCCVGKTKSCFEYLWCYYQQYLQNKNIGYKLSENYKTKWSNMNGSLNPSYGKSGKLNRSSKPVVKLSLTGEYIASYDSCSQAALSEKSLNATKIASCCRHDNKSHHGYRFLFKIEYDSKSQEYWKIFYKSQLSQENKHRNQYNFYRHLET